MFPAQRLIFKVSRRCPHQGCRAAVCTHLGVHLWIEVFHFDNFFPPLSHPDSSLLGFSAALAPKFPLGYFALSAPLQIVNLDLGASPSVNVYTPVFTQARRVRPCQPTSACPLQHGARDRVQRPNNHSWTKSIRRYPRAPRTTMALSPEAPREPLEMP